MQTEPITLIKSLELAAVAVATFIALALDMDADLKVALVGAVSAVALLIGLLLERSAVFSPKSHHDAVASPVAPSPPRRGGEGATGDATE